MKLSSSPSDNKLTHQMDCTRLEDKVLKGDRGSIWKEMCVEDYDRWISFVYSNILRILTRNNLGSTLASEPSKKKNTISAVPHRSSAVTQPWLPELKR